MIICAAGVEDVTPQKPCPLAGFLERRGIFEKVADPLEVNALVLRADGGVVVIMTADLLFVTESIKERIWRLSGADRSIPYHAFLFAGSHTHFAPAVDPSKPLLGEVAAEYVDFFVDRGARLLERLLRAQGEPVTLEFSSGRADHAVNRRRRDLTLRWGFPPVARHFNMAPDPRRNGGGLLQSIAVKRADGSLCALVWNYPCHPVSFPDRNAVSADFPGVARRLLRDEAGEAGCPLPVLFLQGFAGDLRPAAIKERYPLTLPGAKSFLYDLVNGRSFGAFSPEGYREWSLAIARDLLKVVASSSAVGEILLDSMLETVPLEELVAGAPQGRSLQLQRVSLNKRLHFIALSAEPVVEYLEEVGRIFVGETVLAVGCIGDVFGYLPTAEMVREGGYEGGGFFEAFGLTGTLRDSLQDRVRASLQRLRVP